MSLTGVLSDFSLPELFRFLYQGQKTGLLSVQPISAELGPQASYHIWLQQGRIVAAADRLDNHGLLSLIEKRRWLSDRAASKLVSLCSIDMPMGMCLKNHGALQSDQLKFLFQVQVLQQVCALFKLPNGQFNFVANSSLPLAEMTGLSIPATEVTLPGLRSLRDWSALENKLPDLNSALLSNSNRKPNVQLDTKEWQVWEYADGTASLQTIAEDLQLATAQIQRIGFRLMVAGLVEEVDLILPEFTNSTETPIAPTTNVNTTNHFNSAASGSLVPKPVGIMPTTPASAGTMPVVSTSLVKNLVNFLRSKV